MTRVYVSDTNIWIDFRHAELLDELFLLDLTLCCTDFVLAELTDFDHGHLLGRGLVVESIDSTTMLRLGELIRDHNNSSLADVSCYLLAHDTKRPLLTGDGRLRKQALRDGLEVRGALWLLDRLVDQQLIPPARAAAGLSSMLARGARLPEAECEARMALWKIQAGGSSN